MRIKEALNLYERSTGQLINPTKCSLLFSAFCQDARQEEIRRALQIVQTTFEEKYLGLPTPEGRMKSEKFQSMKERLAKRMTDWSEKHMSAAAKEVLVKSVAQAFPTYTVGVFKLPQQFCDDYAQMVRNFWWGHSSDERKVHWISWDKLTSPKSHGGLGFRDMNCFNQALLARQAWRLLTVPESLCACVLKAKYYPNGMLTDTSFPQVSSPSWKGIVHGLDLLKKGLIWRIGDGQITKIWRHHWIGHGNRLEPLKKKTWNRLTYVCELMILGTKEWNEPLIRLVMKEDDALEILKTRIPANETTDYPAWHFEKTGLFSVRSAYKLAWTMNNVVSSSSSTSMDGERKLWQNIWKADVQPKVKVFACKLAQNRLPTWENKRKRQIEARGTCPICGQVEESGFHATVECTKSKALRDTLRKFWSLPDEKEFVMSGPDWLLVLLESLNSNDKAHVMYLLWRAWFLRNDSIHGVGAAKVYDSALFLVNYENKLLPVRQTSDDTKGKGKMFADRRGEEQIKEKQTCKWECPPEGFAKINVDAVFLEESGLSSVGIIVRDCRGLILLAAHKTLHRYNSVV